MSNLNSSCPTLQTLKSFEIILFKLKKSWKSVKNDQMHQKWLQVNFCPKTLKMTDFSPENWSKCSDKA